MDLETSPVNMMIFFENTILSHKTNESSQNCYTSKYFPKNANFKKLVATEKPLGSNLQVNDQWMISMDLGIVSKFRF